MRNWAIIGVVALLLPVPKAFAGFVLTTSRSLITQGPFQNDDGVTVFIQNDGNGTTDPNFHADLVFYELTMAATVGTANPRFFIHTWNQTIHSTASPATNTFADFGAQGFLPGDANRDTHVNGADINVIVQHLNAVTNAWTSGDLNGDGHVNGADINLVVQNLNAFLPNGSYIRFGDNSVFDYYFPLNIIPAENSQTFTEGQSVSSIYVQALVLNSSLAGLPDSVPTPLAFAVVPQGQGVTFSGFAQGHAGSELPISVTDVGSGLTPMSLASVPEPVSIGLISLTAIALRRVRRC